MTTKVYTYMPPSAFDEWMQHGERGRSSDAIMHTLTGFGVGFRHDHPYDPSDFRRCELLLRQVPGARERLPLMKANGPQWSGLVDAWDELVALGESEVPLAFTGARTDGRAPKMYARMQTVMGRG